MKRPKSMWTLFAMLLLLFCVPSAHAAPLTPLTLYLSSGSTNLTITDEFFVDPAYLGTPEYGRPLPGTDFNPAAGLIVFDGAVGDFFVSLTIGSSYPALGNSALAELNLQSFNVSTPVAGTLTIGLFDTGYGSPESGFSAAPGDTLSVNSFANGFMMNAKAGSSVQVNSWLNATPVLAGAADASAPVFMFNNSTPFIYDGTPFSMFSQATIHFTGAADANPITGLGGTPIRANLSGVDVSVTNDPVPVPEPGSLLLLSTGLFLSAAFVRRRQRK